MSGFLVNDEVYTYRKNLQGDIIGIYKLVTETDGDTEKTAAQLAARYEYDAWGNHAVHGKDEDGNWIKDTDGSLTDISKDGLYSSHIGNLNPFRYRGYLFDSETGLYYLQSRYYDPEIGRFISPDDIAYIEPERLNGLNLYAYCGNNPVMYVDPTGEFPLLLLVGFAIGLISGAFGSVIGQLMTTGNVNGWVVLNDAILGGILGAIGMTGIGMIGQAIWGGLISGANYISNAFITGEEKDITGDGLIANILLGAFFQALSGDGIKYKNRSVIDMEKNIVNSIKNRSMIQFKKSVSRIVEKHFSTFAIDTLAILAIQISTKIATYWIKKMQEA